MYYSNPFHRIINASRYSLQGLYHALKNEQAFRYEAFVFCVLCMILCFIPLGLLQKLLIAGMWIAVMCLELINSAVEEAFNLIDKNYRPEIKSGKDMLSAAVFLMVCMNIVVWLAVLASIYIFPEAELFSR